MYDFEKLDVHEWQEVLRIRQHAIKAYMRAAVQNEDLPAADVLIEKQLASVLNENELDILKHSLVPPELTLRHNWNEPTSEAGAEENSEEEKSPESELMERGDASNAVLFLNNVIEMNNAMLHQWLHTIADFVTIDNADNSLVVVAALNDNSFLLSFVMDAVLRHYKSMAQALVTCVRSNTVHILTFIRKNFEVDTVLPKDFSSFESDFISMLDEFVRSVENLDNN